MRGSGSGRWGEKELGVVREEADIFVDERIQVQEGRGGGGKGGGNQHVN